MTRQIGGSPLPPPQLILYPSNKVHGQDCTREFYYLEELFVTLDNHYL